MKTTQAASLSRLLFSNARRRRLLHLLVDQLAVQLYCRRRRRHHRQLQLLGQARRLWAPAVEVEDEEAMQRVLEGGRKPEMECVSVGGGLRGVGIGKDGI